MTSTPPTAPDFALLFEQLKPYVDVSTLHRGSKLEAKAVSIPAWLLRDVAAALKQHPSAPAPQPQWPCPECGGRNFHRLECGIGANNQCTTAPQVDEALLFEFLKHGDSEHRAWLAEAIAAFFADKPKPVQRAHAPHAAATVLPQDVARIIDGIRNGTHAYPNHYLADLIERLARQSAEADFAIATEFLPDEYGPNPNQATHIPEAIIRHAARQPPSAAPREGEGE
jgi:hypothetical protein